MLLHLRKRRKIYDWEIWLSCLLVKTEQVTTGIHIYQLRVCENGYELKMIKWELRSVSYDLKVTNRELRSGSRDPGADPYNFSQNKNIFNLTDWL
jgi:hypothetical protein